MSYTRRSRKSSYGRNTLRRGGEFSEMTTVNKFRRAFIRVVSSDNIDQDQIVGLFKRVKLEKMNRYLVNVLIPVIIENDKYVPVLDKEIAVDYVPLLCIVFQRIRDVNVLQHIIRQYTKHHGNLNLISLYGKVSAIDTAFAEKNMELVKYLMSYTSLVVPEYIREQIPVSQPLPLPAPLPLPSQPSPKVISTIPPRPPSPKVISTKAISPKVMMPPSPPKVPPPPVLPQKLLYMDSPVTEYAPNEEPAFWLPLFPEGDLTKLRNNLTQIISEDVQIEAANQYMTQMWGICKRVRDIIPKFAVPQDIPKPFYEERTGVYKAVSVKEFAQYNIILCATFLIYGIIANKMNTHNQDYSIIFKGGKGVQLALSNVKGVPSEFQYESEDIDILLMPKSGVTHNPHHAQALASNIAFLVKWLLSNTFQNQISVLLPTDKRAKTKTIVKLSYFMARFKQFSDISFDELLESEKMFFEGTSMMKPKTKTKKIDGLDENAAFIFQPVDKIVDEKIHFICKYLHLLKTERLEKYVHEDYIRVINKFKRTVIEISRATHLTEMDKYIRERFIGLGQKNVSIDEFMYFMMH